MAISKRDEQRVPTLIGVSSVDGVTPELLEVDPVTGELLVKSSPVPATGINGAPIAVGTSAVEMTFTGITKVIVLKAASTNTGLIWFGPSTVDDAGANAWGELTADAAITIELNDASEAIYCVSDTASQKVYKAALT